MAKQRHQIKSECPECGCGLVDGMTPDEFREKHGKNNDKTTGNSGESDKGGAGSVPEQNTSSQNRAES